VAGLKAAIIGYAVLGVIAVIFLAILVPDPGKSTSTGEENAINAKMGVKDWISIVTNPRTWLSGNRRVRYLHMYCTLSYYTPYFSNVLGVSVVFTGGLSIFRQYGTVSSALRGRLAGRQDQVGLHGGGRLSGRGRDYGHRLHAHACRFQRQHPHRPHSGRRYPDLYGRGSMFASPLS
jgi:predicted MFS family arabinose efflux permease